jgi:hypothetical protein
MVKLALSIIVFFCLSIPVQAFEKITINIDKRVVASGQSLLLTVTADDRLPASSIDLTPLFKSFAVGDIKFNETSGSGTLNTEWQIPLLPRNSGEITIPSLKVAGAATSPLTIQVSDAIQPHSSRSPLLEVSLTPEQLYARQAAIYSLKLHLPTGVEVDSLSPPQLEKGSLRQLGEDNVRNEIINGRRTKSLVRYYAIYSDEPGQKVIKGPLLQGVQQERGISKPFLEQAPDMMITVLSTPVDAHYLPSKEVRIEESIMPDGGPYKVGEPVIRQIHLYARGVLKEQLPDIPLPKQAGVRSYDDGISVQERIENGEVYVEKSIRQALLPQEAGRLLLPAIAIPWWNTSTYTVVQAKLPGRTIQISASALRTKNQEIPAVQGASGSSYFWIAFSVIFSLVTTLLALLWLTRKRLATTKLSFRLINDKITWRKLKKALHKNNPREIHNALLIWARQRWPEQAPSCIEALPCYPDLRTELDALLAACYSGEPIPIWDPRALRQALRKWREANQSSQECENPHGLL